HESLCRRINLPSAPPPWGRCLVPFEFRLCCGQACPRTGGFDNIPQVRYSDAVKPSDARQSLFSQIIFLSWSTCLLPIATFAEQPLPQVERLKTSAVLHDLKLNPMPVPPHTPAEQTVAQMYLPEGFRA